MRFLLGVLGCTSLSLLGCSADPDVPARPGQMQQAIRNGTREPQRVPLSEGQKLALGWLATTDRPNSNFCTATLIAPDLIVTAAHCTSRRRGTELAFGVGLFPNDPVATFRGAQKFEHPDVDAALIRLTEIATDRVPELEPIGVNFEPLTPSMIGREVEAGGYGETRDPSLFGRFFAVVELIDFNDEVLRVDGRGQQGICFGDSGGPVLTVNDAGEAVILGVEQGGDSSCVGVDELTRLDAIEGWLRVAMEGGVPPNECGDLDQLGRCVGQVAEWCDGGSLGRRDCGARNLACEYVDDEVGYWCVQPPPCGEVSVGGFCDGDTVTRCRFGRLAREDCTLDEEICRADRSGAFCTDPSVPLPDAGPEPDAASFTDARAGGEPVPDSGSERADAGGEAPDAGAPPEDAELKPRGGGGCQQGGAPEALLLLPMLLLGLRPRPA